MPQDRKPLRPSENGWRVYFSRDYLGLINQTRLPKKDIARSFDLHARIEDVLTKKEPEKVGDFTLGFCAHAHLGGDAPLAIEVKNAKGCRIATVGGYFHYTGTTPTIRITNVQGANGPVPGSEAHRKHQEQYRKLSEALGENWRVHLVKRVVNYAKERDWRVVGEMPGRFLMMCAPLASDGEYARQIRQYKQTYRKAGLKEQPNGTWATRPTRKVPPKQRTVR